MEAEGAKAIAASLVQNHTLTNINLGANSIRDDGAKAIAYALSHNTTLTSVNLQDNMIEKNGTLAILDALKKNTAITQLHLFGWNVIVQDHMSSIHSSLNFNKVFKLTSDWTQPEQWSSLGASTQQSIEELFLLKTVSTLSMIPKELLGAVIKMLIMINTYCIEQIV